MAARDGRPEGDLHEIAESYISKNKGPTRIRGGLQTLRTACRCAATAYKPRSKLSRAPRLLPHCESVSRHATCVRSTAHPIALLFGRLMQWSEAEVPLSNAGAPSSSHAAEAAAEGRQAIWLLLELLLPPHNTLYPLTPEVSLLQPQRRTSRSSSGSGRLACCPVVCTCPLSLARGGPEARGATAARG